MKKQILIIVMCVLLILSSALATETAAEADAQCGFAISINGELTEHTSIILNNTHYLPARTVFEETGSLVFFRKRDSRILVLTRDGDMIYHSVGSNAVTVNGEIKSFQSTSLSENFVTYLPADMISAALRTTGAVTVSDGQISIKKPISDTAYGKAVKDVMDASKCANFYPEKFKRYINYHIKKPASGMQDVLFMVNLNLDFPFYENVSVISNPYDTAVLVNKYNRLPWDFKQNNLVNMDRKYTVNDGKQYLLAGVAYENFVRMADAARKDGVSLKVVSAYRTQDYQQRLYNKKIRTLGARNADDYSAKPGFSEHQTGLAIDINSTKPAFVNTAAFKWLESHAHEYGYILRYPKGKKWITGYEYEPWHYRYVGSSAAKIIHQEGSTYEQYYAKYIAVNEFK